MRITLYHDPDEPKLYVAGEYDDPGPRGDAELHWHLKFGRRKGWAESRARRHWASLRMCYPVRLYLQRLAKHLRHLDDFTLELADGTTLTGDEAKAYVRRYA